jgi:hypothetical protein
MRVREALADERCGPRFRVDDRRRANSRDDRPRIDGRKSSAAARAAAGIAATSATTRSAVAASEIQGCPRARVAAPLCTSIGTTRCWI